MSLSRLLLPASAMWMGALALELLARSPAFPAQATAQVALVASLAALPCLALLWWRVPRFRTAHAGAVLAGACLGLLAAALHLAPLVSDPLATLVEQRSTVSIIGVVQSQGRLVQSPRSRLWQQSPQYEFQLASSRLISPSSAWEVALPFSVLGGQPPPAIGTEVRIRGRLAAGELPVTAAVLNIQGAVETIEQPGFVDATANALRSGLLHALIDRPPEAAALVAGLAIGDQSLQSQSLSQAMRTAGLSHLTAVSGGNVAVIIVMVLGLTRLCRLRLGAQVCCCLIALGWFVVLVRPQPSVLRAAVMGAVVLVGMLTGGQRRGTGVLAASILLLIAVAPELAGSWAFALSVAATAGLILLAPMVAVWMHRHWRLLPAPVIEAVAVSLTAQLATMPIIIGMGSTVGLAGIPANLLAMPVVPVVTVLGLLTAALGTFLPSAALLTALMASWFASWIASVAYAMSALPLAVVPWPSGVPGLGMVLLLMLTVLISWRFLGSRGLIPRPGRLAFWAGCLLLLMLAISAWLGSHRGWPMPNWVLVACDVGQGDALVVRTGQASAMLVDTGVDGRDVDRCLRRLGIASLDAIVLTHFHADHVGGLEAALHDRQIGQVFATPTLDPAFEAAGVVRELRARGLDLTLVRAGQVHQLGRLRWSVLWPSHTISTGSIPNNASVVILVEVDGLRLLLTGDIEPEAQAALMAENSPPRVDIAKIPHHGSRFQDADFARWTGARLALVSVGSDNDYGHPAASTLQQWQEEGSEVWRTDVEGSIAVGRGPDGSLGVVAMKD